MVRTQTVITRTPHPSVPGSARLAVGLATVLLVAACSGAVPPTAVPTTAIAPAVRLSPSAATDAAVAQPTAPPAATSPTQELIEFFAARVAEDPDDGEAQLQLGLALLQRIRETTDPSIYPAAEAALQAARRLRPDDPLPLVGLGGILLGKHDFAEALQIGQAAAALDPSSSGAGAVVVDALIELGRYDEAFAAADDLVSAAPDLASLARLSYTRELRGDLEGALAAMEDAASSPGLAPENTAFALAQVGQLHRLTGHPDAARAAYERALALVPDHAPSIAGLGRLAVGDGDLVAALGYFDRASAVLPLPEYVIALGETHEATGDANAALALYDLARAQIALFQASGVAIDLELALFEADHGDPARALDLAQAAYDATPTIRAADALAWALHRAGRDAEAWDHSTQALRLGSRDPLLRYHAGAIAAALGRNGLAKEHLGIALAADPGFSPTGAAEARSLLEALPPGP